MSTKQRIWFGCKCIFLHQSKKAMFRGRNLYEESILLVKAASFAEAERKAEHHARLQASNGVEFCGVVTTYAMLDQSLRNGAEAFSAFRTSRLKPEEFTRRFYRSRSCFCIGGD